MKQTGLLKEEITKVFNQFVENNPDEKLDKNEFTRLMLRLRSLRPNESVEKISEYVFKVFDTDNNGECFEKKLYNFLIYTLF